MSDATLDGVFVLLCDWRGHCDWTSVENTPLQPGDLVWKNLTSESQTEMQSLLGRVVTLRETQVVEVVNQRGMRFRIWMWPLSSPEMAVCLLGMRIPTELERLTKREQEILEMLAQGIETRNIADQFDVSVSTVHTHMKRAREKLDLRSVEELISFAARYCYPQQVPLHRELA